MSQQFAGLGGVSAYYARPRVARGVRQRGRRSRRFAGLGTGELTLNAALVRDIQDRLNTLPSAYPKLVVDGIVGPKTAERVKEFQRSVGLPQDGFPGADMRALLFGVTVGAPIGTATGSGSTAGSGGITDTLYGIWNSIFGTGSGVYQAGQASSTASATAIQAALATAKAGAGVADSARKSAVQFLADNGNLIAKFALIVGVSYTVAMTILIGGGIWLGLSLFMGGGGGGGRRR